MTDKKEKKPIEKKNLIVIVLRAVDAYHYRNATLVVPNDEYHQNLIKQGNLKEVE